MKTKIPLILRVVLAIILLTFGLNKFLGFLSMPPPPPEGGKYLGQLMASGFIFNSIGIIFILSAILLLTNKAVPFALIILAPITYNIIFYHLKFDPEIKGLMPGLIIAILQVKLAFVYRSRFVTLFS